jgi:perosamine synthetase
MSLLWHKSIKDGYRYVTGMLDANPFLMHHPSPTTDRVPSIPLAEPCLDQTDVDAVVACLRSGWVSTTSPLVSQFETAMAHFLGVPATLALNCGTSAIHLALLLAGVQPGDKVAVPALSFVATVNPVRYCHAIPVFVDVDPHTFGMSPHALADALREHPDIKAIVVTHLYGHMADIASIKALAGDRPVIEDAAEALGSRLNHQYAGTLADYGCFSFNGNKIITTGSGGLLVCQEPNQLQQARLLATQGKAPDGEPFDHAVVGYNYRMNGIQAALGLSQLAKLPQLLRQKVAIAQFYAQLIPQWTPHLQHLNGQVPWLSTVVLPNAQQREGINALFHQHKLATRPFFKPLPLLTPYQPWASSASYLTATRLWQQGLCLPSSGDFHPEQKYWHWLAQKPLSPT